MMRIDSLWAFIAADADGEGLTGFMSPSGWMPMVAADEARVASLRPIAEDIAKASGKEVRLVRFSVRTEIEVIGGPDLPTKTKREFRMTMSEVDDLLGKDEG